MLDGAHDLIIAITTVATLILSEARWNALSKIFGSTYGFVRRRVHREREAAAKDMLIASLRWEIQMKDELIASLKHTAQEVSLRNYAESSSAPSAPPPSPSSELISSPPTLPISAQSSLTKSD